MRVVLQAVRLLAQRGSGRAAIALERIREYVSPTLGHPVSSRQFREGRHIFIFGVWGRSSTTALQRILNSSAEVCIWGEPGDFIVDDLLRVLTCLREKNVGSGASQRKLAMARAFRSAKHNQDYAMAFPELQPSMDLIVDAFAEMLAPAIPTDRLGFKEITLRNINTLERLQELCPNAKFVFTFRDPTTQWPSVRAMRWERTDTLDAFLEEYARLAEIYLSFGGIFIETTSMRDEQRMRSLCEKLSLTSFDTSLIDDGVFSKKDKKPITEIEREIIHRHRAWTFYQQMVAVEAMSFDRLRLTS